jgi:hypothetical protein
MGRLPASEYKMAQAHGDMSVPRPRTPDLDALEVARIRKLVEARDLKHRVDQKIQAAHVAQGVGVFITDRAPSRDVWAAGLGKSADGYRGQGRGRP